MIKKVLKRDENMEKKISIIIPVYNAGKFLPQCIKSVLGQTYFNVELILINDGSTDSSDSIIRSFTKQDERIIYKKIKNSGVSNARNLGISISTGDYIMFVDADDIIDSTLVEVMTQYCSTFKFVMTGYRIVNQIESPIKEFCCPDFMGDIIKFCEVIDQFLSPPFLLGPCFKLFDAKVIKDNQIFFPRDISYGEDAEFVLLFLSHVENVCCINYTGYSYRKHGKESLSSKFIAEKMDIFARLNNDIRILLSQYHISKEYYLQKRLVENFVSFTHEIVSCPLKMREKKTIFFHNARKYDILEILNKMRITNKAQKIIRYSIKYNSFLILWICFFFRDHLMFIIRSSMSKLNDIGRGNDN